MKLVQISWLNVRKFECFYWLHPNLLFFRHSAALLGLCSIAAPLSNLTPMGFAFYSMPLNIAMLYFSYKFYQNPDAQTSRSLFRYSLLYLPLIMLLMVVVNHGNNFKNVAEKSSLNPPLPGMLKKVPSPVDIKVHPRPSL